MFQHFTDQARMAMAFANRAAQEDLSAVILPKHICLGLLQTQRISEAQFLRHAADSTARLQAALARIPVPTSGREVSSEQRVAAKHAVEFAVQEARELGTENIGPEHLLLGLFRLGDPSLEQAMVSCGLDLAVTRQALRDMGGLDTGSHEESATQSPPKAEVTRSERAAEPVGAYPHARRAGGLLFLAGLGPRKRGSKDIPGVKVDAGGCVIDYDIEAQIRSCFENVRMVVEEAGSRWENIVDVVVFLTDMKRDFATFNRLWQEYFPTPFRQPTRTTIEVSALPQAGNAPINFEVKVVATI